MAYTVSRYLSKQENERKIKISMILLSLSYIYRASDFVPSIAETLQRWLIVRLQQLVASQPVKRDIKWVRVTQYTSSNTIHEQ